ncbi:putative DNA-binding transcriptional regulator YafY [Paenibacillus forsythiae]|uniref:DNA-binding transcriptional regulator YafY n=1 Tax=Paenibacillus forsythiae TaxID=365616 RepID=A0ABU3HAV1_9BACL|nr:WYL domain-containing protein [Paenibacillus forsythiae]MDT3427157.1 putative DNA-binding transcriptional regulator YafY [Paenibacillus forsythiae]
MTDRLIRLMRIITLVQAKPGILARELAERCGTSERTIYRDMDALSAMHIPITHMGHGKGYAFIGNFALYPLDWSSEESAAFSQLSDTIEMIKPLMPRGFESAYEKVMAAEYKHKADREEKREEKMENAKKEVGSLWLERNGAVPEQFHLIHVLNAVLKQTSIRADYFDNAQEENGLEIDPYYLVPLENRFHLIGYCHRLKVIRSFHIHDLTNVKMTDKRFSKEPFNLQEFTKQKWSMDEDSLRVVFKVRFSDSVLEEIRKGKSEIVPVKIEQQGKYAYFDVSLERDREFIDWVTKFKEAAEIIEPAHYREVLRYQLEKWLSLYK